MPLSQRHALTWKFYHKPKKKSGNEPGSDGRKLNDDEREGIKGMLRDGHSIDKCAEAYDTSSTTVYRIKKELRDLGGLQ